MPSAAPPLPLSIPAALFYGHCSCVALPSGDMNICSSACLKASCGREILITAALYVCVCVHDLRRCVCAGKRAHGCVRECIHLCACVCLVLCKVILIILTSQCPILGERQAGDGGETGWERERRGKRDVLPPRQTPFIWTTESDQWFPLGVCYIGRPAAQAAFRSGNN